MLLRPSGSPENHHRHCQQETTHRCLPTQDLSSTCANVSENSTITLFADVHEIFGGSTELLTKDSLGQELLRSCEFIGLWATLQKKSISGEAVLSLSQGQNLC